MPEPDDERVWEQGYAGHERAQLLRMARLPLYEKLAWLEETQRLAAFLASQSQRGGRPAP